MANVDEFKLFRLINEVKMCAGDGDRFCFILGAGASASSGIKLGTEMAAIWLKELKKNEPTKTEKWLNDKKIDESKIGEYYSEIYKRNFFQSPKTGYKYLQKEMKNARPGYGYIQLANILAAEKSSVNLVITTNFDSLTEDAVTMYTSKKPLVVSHESLAKYVDINTNRPIVIKIHRDLFFEPIAENTSNIAEEWVQVLEKILNLYPNCYWLRRQRRRPYGVFEEVCRRTRQKETHLLVLSRWEKTG